MFRLGNPQFVLHNQWGLSDLDFTQGGFSIMEDEYKDIKFFLDNNPDDYIFIGDGKYMITAKLTDEKTNFDVWAITEENTLGPVSILEFMRECELLEVKRPKKKIKK